MGYIEKRGKNTWRISTHTKTVSGKTEHIHVTLHMDPALSESVQRQDAQRELELLENRLAAEAETARTVRGWSEEWLTKLIRPDASPVTIANYRFLLDSRILPILGDYALKDLTPAILTDWLIRIRSDQRKTTRKKDEDLTRDRRPKEQSSLIPAGKLKKPLSAKTALNYYACLSTMLAAAVRMGYLDYNPMDRVQRPRQKRNASRKTLSEEDATQLIQLLDDLPPEDQCYRLAVLLALICGLRLGEVGALKYTDINWDQQTIDISRALKYTPATGSFTADPKTDAAVRTITLPPSMITLLKDARDQDAMEEIDISAEDEEAGRPYRYQSNHLIVHGRFGRPMNKDTPSKWFRRFADANGFPDTTFHDLRHAHASILVSNNVDIAAVASRMGHSDATVTLSTYTHPYDAHDRQAAAILDHLLQPDQQPDQRPPDPQHQDDPAGPPPTGE